MKWGLNNGLDDNSTISTKVALQIRSDNYFFVFIKKNRLIEL